jgi:hypothetical protein
MTQILGTPKLIFSPMSALTTQEYNLRETEARAAEYYFLETGLDFYDLTYVEQKKKIMEAL